MTCGELTGSLGFLVQEGRGDITVQIPACLIEHAKGTLLFDPGSFPQTFR